jgi:hypothetical protein
MAPVNGTKRARSRADTEEFADDSGYAEASSNLRQRNSAVSPGNLHSLHDTDIETAQTPAPL